MPCENFPIHVYGARNSPGDALATEIQVAAGTCKLKYCNMNKLYIVPDAVHVFAIKLG